MAGEQSSNYAQVSIRDDDESDELSDTQSYEDHAQRLTREPSVPAIEISPPHSPLLAPIPPARSDTEDTYVSAVARPLSHSNSEVREHAQQPAPDNRRHSSLTVLKEKFHGSFTPSLHELLEKTDSDPSTRRQYNRRTQRWRLWRLTIGEFFNTFALCIVYFGILYTYSHKPKISVPQRRVFNALTTGTSLLLGVNLAASLRSYAKLLRWRMLAICYRPLETFDLVMGCDSLINVIKLLWRAKNDRYRFLPSRTQIICFVWLLVHLAITLLVGIIGLNYNLDDSPTALFLRTGNVSIVDLDALLTGDYAYDLAQVQQWGLRGIVIEPLDLDAPAEFQQSYFSDSAGFTIYYFQDQNAEDQNEVVVSTRQISAQAYCTGYDVGRGQYGNLSYVIYNDGEKEVNQTLAAIPGPGGLLVVSKFNSTCGERCTNMQAFQAATLPTVPGSDEDLGYTIPGGMYFTCNNTLYQVGDDRNPDLDTSFLTYDLVGRMLAGGLGWSDLPSVFNNTAEYAIYTNSSRVSFGGQPIDTDMANLISRFTMGAISFMDNSPFMGRKNVTSDEQPSVAQILKVKWRYAGAILAVLPFIHFLTLTAVILWANKAIIKDDSHLAISKAYHTLLDRLGDRGCLLRGDEIISVLENPKVIYSWQAENDEASLMHVDVFEQSQDIQRMRSQFKEGWYNGKGTLHPAATPRNSNILPRKPYRDLDAGEYF